MKDNKLQLKITMIDPKTKDETEVTNYELKNGYLKIHEFGCVYVFPTPDMIELQKPFYYTDSIFPIDKPTEQIINKYIRVVVYENLDR